MVTDDVCFYTALNNVSLHPLRKTAHTGGFLEGACVEDLGRFAPVDFKILISNHLQYS